MGNITWTDEQVELIKELLELKYQARKIADEMNARFNVQISRSAIISKFRRLKIAMMKPVKPVKQASPKRRIKKKKQKMNRELKPELWCTIMELTRARCHWPYGDNPPFKYCGAPTYKPTDPTQRKSSYCPFHREIVKQKPKEMTDAI